MSQFMSTCKNFEDGYHGRMEQQGVGILISGMGNENCRHLFILCPLPSLPAQVNPCLHDKWQWVPLLLVSQTHNWFCFLSPLPKHCCAYGWPSVNAYTNPTCIHYPLSACIYIKNTSTCLHILPSLQHISPSQIHLYLSLSSQFSHNFWTLSTLHMYPYFLYHLSPLPYPPLHTNTMTEQWFIGTDINYQTQVLWVIPTLQEIQE